MAALFEQRPRQFSLQHPSQSPRMLHQQQQQQQQQQQLHQTQQNHFHQQMSTQGVTTLGAIPLFSRSISAPHMQFSSLGQDVLISGRPSVHLFPQQQQQQQQQPQAFPIEFQQMPPFGQDSSTTTAAASRSTAAVSSASPTQPMQHQPNFSSGLFPPSSAANNSCGSGGPNFIYQPSVHPFQVDQLTTSFDDLDMAIAPRVKLEFPVETYLHPSPVPTVGSDSPEVFHPHMEEALPSQAVFSCSPSTSASSESDSSPKFAHSFDDPTSSSVYMGPFRPPLRGQSVSFFETPMSAFDNGDEYPEYAWSRHGSTGSLFPMGHQHYHSDDFHPEYLMSAVEGAHHNHHQHQQQHHQHLQPQHQSKESVPMIPTSSSTSILSTASTSSSSSSNSQSTTPSAKKVRTRRASVCTDTQGPIFQCRFGDCHRPFRRQEHLKRHVRSVHTLEKPFECPVNSCTRRFSRSDNLNQHIRIHRHDNAEQGATPATAPPITFAYHQPQYRQP